MAPKAVSATREPIWRLLDPEPIDHQLLHGLWLNDFETRAGSDEMSTYWDLPVKAFQPFLDLNTEPQGADGSRLRLQDALFIMRQGEARGDIEAYSIGLWEALLQCRLPKIDDGLAVLPGCDEFLLDFFGRVVYTRPTAKFFAVVDKRLEELRCATDSSRPSRL